MVDYRGYGQSTGWPTASTMLADSRPVLDFVAGWLKKRRGRLDLRDRDGRRWAAPRPWNWPAIIPRPSPG
ncbi:MAG: hypothetical protein U5O69_00030 [Candidatus Competibacteraceae bacterium]|nr:hypothetical protein [Candidatus Competibacteraceae bacterium]